MISIIIPTYQPQDYLWQCLDSFAAQTLDKRLWELVVILNGCNEPWKQQIEAYKAIHSDMSMQIIQTDQAGVSNARNLGLDNAKGEYIGFVDDDDYVSPEYLEKLANIATPQTIAASYTMAFDDKHNHIPYYVESTYHACARRGSVPYYVARKYFSGPWLKIIHRDIIGDRRFDTHFILGEDSLFMFLISDRMNQMSFTDQRAVYYRRMRPSSASRKLSWSQRAHNCKQLLHEYTHIYKNGEGYSFSFYITRILGLIHSVIQ